MPPVHPFRLEGKGRVAPKEVPTALHFRGSWVEGSTTPFFLGEEMEVVRKEDTLVAKDMADLLTPLSVFLALRELGANVLLESLEEGRYWGRYSIIGFGKPGPRFDQADRRAWEELRRYLRDKMREASVTDSPLEGGLVGHFSYDLVTHLEPVPLPERELVEVPQMAFLKVEDLIVFDNLKGEVNLISTQGEGFVREIEKALKLPRSFSPPSEGKVASKPLSTFTKEGFCEAVKRTREMILDGEAIQVVLAQIFTVESPRDPLSVYRHLRRINPSPYMFFLDMGDYVLVGSSPEVMVRLKDGWIETRPIAGTRPRTGDPQKDREMLEELLHDPKEEAEHVMLVDLARNDLGRVSEMGTVEVTEFKQLEAYSHVFHLVSHVRGKLREGLDAVDVLWATFPAGTLSGAPKVRAMQIISEMEPTRRGIYGGAVGYIDFRGNMDTCITIRSVLHKDGLYYLGAGAGIVADSVPEREYQETLSKAKGPMKALGVEGLS